MENNEYKRQMDKMREELISGVSHDMKTPLSSLKGYTDLLSYDQFGFSKEQTTHIKVVFLSCFTPKIKICNKFNSSA
jgi:K+-sensing histidine kinase KdpD